jgi:outer membrane protein
MHSTQRFTREGKSVRWRIRAQLTWLHNEPREFGTQAISAPGVGRVEILARILITFVLLLGGHRLWGQVAPVSPDRPWQSPQQQAIKAYTEQFRGYPLTIDPTETYTLADLVDLAESHNPQTRLAWERARAQAAALGVARSELYPTLAAAAIPRIDRVDILFATQYYLQTLQAYQAVLDLNYTVFDFGARAGRIARARAEVLAANFGFNDTHRQVIYQVEQAYYQLLNALGQEDAARASLANAQTVQQAAEARLRHGLATLPDVLEARSATAQAQYTLQATLGAEQNARGDLATAIGCSPTSTIRVQPLNQLTIPDSISETVDQAIQLAFGQRPDLLQQVAQIRSARASVKEARAALFPTLTFNAIPSAQELYGLQQPLTWTHGSAYLGGLSLTFSWTVFDGGARRNNFREAESNLRASEAQVHTTQDQIADEVWTAYSNLQTAFRQRQAATALLQAASQSYAAALEAYKYGVRNLLDVTAAQQTLAQARSTDVLARTQVLSALADLAFRTGEAIQPGARVP